MENKRTSLENRLMNLSSEEQIKLIQKEVQLYKTIFFKSCADYQFEVIRNNYEWDAEQTENFEEKLALYLKMFQEISNYIFEECHGNPDPHYPECAFVDTADVKWQKPEQITDTEYDEIADLFG